jgi:uncharacterized protein
LLLKNFFLQVVAVVATILFLAVACVSATFNSKTAMVLPVDGTPLVIQTSAGPVNITLEIARTNVEHGMGLMYRDKLPENHGMLFVFEDKDILNFWMHNTPQPLDIIFVAEDGSIATIKAGALSDDIISSELPALYVLEVAAGEAARLHLAKGDKMQHPAIVPALK